MDRSVTVVGLVVEELRNWFTPEQAKPPIGGGTVVVHLDAGDTYHIPFLEGGCGDCGEPWLWVRMTRRWRQALPGGERTCVSARVIEVEAGIARCAELDLCGEELDTRALVLMDDAWRIDQALCAAMGRAEELPIVSVTTLGIGDPVGPTGGFIAWVQTATAQLL